MAKAKKQESVKVNDKEVLIFRGNKPLTKEEFELMTVMIDQQMKGQDIPYVIVPFSADVTVGLQEGGEDDGNDTPGQNEEGTETK